MSSIQTAEGIQVSTKRFSVGENSVVKRMCYNLDTGMVLSIALCQVRGIQSPIGGNKGVANLVTEVMKDANGEKISVSAFRVRETDKGLRANIPVGMIDSKQRIYTVLRAARRIDLDQFNSRGGSWTG